jgi:hypothetical protein
MAQVMRDGRLRNALPSFATFSPSCRRCRPSGSQPPSDVVEISRTGPDYCAGGWRRPPCRPNPHQGRSRTGTTSSPRTSFTGALGGLGASSAFSSTQPRARNLSGRLRLEIGREAAPWIAFWIKELITWGTLDPVAAFLLARGDAIDRPHAEADARAYYDGLLQDHAPRSRDKPLAATAYGR